MLKKLLIVVVFLLGCPEQESESESGVKLFSIVPTPVADMPAVLSEIAAQDDALEEVLRYWTMDSLEKHMRLTPQDSIEIAGKSRGFRSGWFDEKRIEKGNGSRLTTISDSAFNKPNKVVYSSQDILKVVVETYHYRQFSTDLRALFALDSTSFAYYPFTQRNDFNDFLRGLREETYKWKKKHGTLYFVSKDGNDGNDGLTRANAWLTVGKTTGNLAAGDSVVLGVGDWDETLAPTDDGASGNKIMFLDSLTFIDGWDPALPDTNWVSTIDLIALSGDDYFDFLHIGVDGSGAGELCTNATTTGVKYQQCRFTNPGNTSRMFRFNGTNTNDSLVSCLFTDAASRRGVHMESGSTGNFLIANNTIHSSFTNEGFLIDGAAGLNLILKNNIVHQTSSTTSDYAIRVLNKANVIDDWDNNIYYAPSVTNTFSFDGTDFDVLATWADSVNNYDGDGAANTLNEDPDLKSDFLTDYTDSGDAGFEAGEDLGFGTWMGYYQEAAVGGVGFSKGRIMIF